MASLHVLVIGGRDLVERVTDRTGVPRIRVWGPFLPAVAVAAGLEPEVVVADLAAGGPDLITEVAAAFPTARILAAGAEDDLAAIALAAGAAGLFPGSEGDGPAAVRRAAAGEMVIGPDAGRFTERPWWEALTVREREVLRLVAEGATTLEIADRLGIMPATVQRHVSSVLTKLGVRSKVEAATLAWRTGVVAMPAGV